MGVRQHITNAMLYQLS